MIAILPAVMPTCTRCHGFLMAKSDLIDSISTPCARAVLAVEPPYEDWDDLLDESTWLTWEDVG